MNEKLIRTNIIELDDYRPIWVTYRIVYTCCGYEAQAVYVWDADKLECPKCHKMTDFYTNKGKEYQ
jgi:hypothetical protein